MHMKSFQDASCRTKYSTRKIAARDLLFMQVLNLNCSPEWILKWTVGTLVLNNVLQFKSINLSTKLRLSNKTFLACGVSFMHYGNSQPQHFTYTI